MRGMVHGIAAALSIAMTAACGEPAGSLAAARQAMGADRVQAIEITGKGRWFQFGQAASPTLPWPQFDVSSYTAQVNYATPAARVQMTRIQTVEPGRVRPTPTEQRVDQYISGTSAWNVATPPGGSPTTAAQPAAVEERTMEIWTTPQGFLKAAAANSATSTPSGDGSEVSFTIGGKYRYVGTINAQNQVTRVQTWVDNPILGDTPVEFAYSDYRDFGGVSFPGRIVRTQGGHPVLDITVSGVRTEPVEIAVPAEVTKAAPAPVTATAEVIAPGVFYIKGGSHHSVAIDQRDHIVVVEGPLNEARSSVAIAKIKETIPSKPIRYLVNSHHHFDHSGGLRTYVDEGATIVTHELNRPYYEKAWAAPRTINPDRLAQSKRTANFETLTDKHVLTDGKRSIEVHHLAGNGHNDAFVFVYLPTEKVLIEVDAWAPVAANAPAPTAVSPFAVNLHDNIQRLKLDVKHIAALHGPRLATMADLSAAVTPAGTK